MTEEEKQKALAAEKAKARRSEAKGLVKEAITELYEEKRGKQEPPKREPRGFLDYLADFFGFDPDVVPEKKEEKKA
jgi:hypothetical protein